MNGRANSLDSTVSEPEVHVPESIDAPSVFSSAWDFLRRFWIRVLAISAILVTPCLWHQYIEAGDLASHEYNAWLAHLIQTGHAPGLYLVRQWNNVLFDFALSAAGNSFGLHVAEKLVTSAAVLIFFWGAFAFVCAMARKVWWPVCIGIAIFAYGWTFEIGFMNYYLSVGLAFWGLAIVTSGRGWERCFAAALLPLIWMAHPLGAMLLLGAASYIVVAEYLSPKHQILMFALVSLSLLVTHYFLAWRVHHGVWADGHYGINWRSGPWTFLDGFDQLLVYGRQYLVPAYLFRILVFTCIAAEVVQRRKTPRWWSSFLLPAQLYCLTVLAAALLPTGVRFPRYGAPLELLTERLTLVSAVLICCLIGAARPRKWFTFGFAIIAAIYFFQIYNDTGIYNRMENQIAALVRTIQPGDRVLATFRMFPGARMGLLHMVDRACIGQCFTYENYEASSRQFRVRAREENNIVMFDRISVRDAEGGKYIVQHRDLPIFEIYQCDASLTTMCMRELKVGEMNDPIEVPPR